MKPDYWTLTAAIKARAWVRAQTEKRGRPPTLEERVAWIAKHFTAKIDVAYVNRSCEEMEHVDP